MKRILTLLAFAAILLIGSVNLCAQTKKVKAKPEPVKLDPMFYKNGKFSSGYTQLDTWQLGSYFTQNEMQQINLNLQKRKTGVGLLIGGGAGFALFATAGVLGIAASDQLGGPGLGIAFSSVAVASLGVLIAGIPIYCKAEKNLKNAAAGYNQRNNLTLNVTVTSYGPGLSLTF